MGTTADGAGESERIGVDDSIERITQVLRSAHVEQTIAEQAQQYSTARTAHEHRQSILTQLALLRSHGEAAEMEAQEAQVNSLVSEAACSEAVLDREHLIRALLSKVVQQTALKQVVRQLDANPLNHRLISTPRVALTSHSPSQGTRIREHRKLMCPACNASPDAWYQRREAE